MTVATAIAGQVMPTRTTVVQPEYNRRTTVQHNKPRAHQTLPYTRLVQQKSTRLLENDGSTRLVGIRRLKRGGRGKRVGVIRPLWGRGPRAVQLNKQTNELLHQLLSPLPVRRFGDRSFGDRGTRWPFFLIPGTTCLGASPSPSSSNSRGMSRNAALMAGPTRLAS